MVLFFHCIVCNRKHIGSAGQKICKHCLEKLSCARCQKKLSGDGREFDIIKTHGTERIVCVECLSKERFSKITEEIEKLFSENKISAAKGDSGNQKFINSLIPGLTGDTVGKVLTFLSFPKSLKNLYLVSKDFREFFDDTNFFFIETFGDPDVDAEEQDDETIKEDLLQMCKMKNFQGFGHLKRLNYNNLSIKGLLFFLHFVPKSVNSLECVNTWNVRNELHPQLTEIFMNRVLKENVRSCRIETNLVDNVFDREDGTTICLESMRNLKDLWIEGESLPKYKLVIDFKNKTFEKLVLSNCRNHKFEHAELGMEVKELVLNASRTNPYNFSFPNLEKLEIRKDTMLSLRNLSSIGNVNGIKSIIIEKAGPLNPNGFVSYPNLEVLVIPDSLFTMSGLEGFFSSLKKLKHLEVMSMLARYAKVMLEEKGLGLEFVKVHRNISIRDEQILGVEWDIDSRKGKLVIEVKNKPDERLMKKIGDLVVVV